MKTRLLFGLGVLVAFFAVLCSATVAAANTVLDPTITLLGVTLAATNPTLLDLAKRMDPDGSIANIVELLNETNDVLTDMTFVEGNLPTGHRTTVRTGIPAPTWRKLYGSVQPSKSTTAQVTDNCGMLEAYADLDKALAELNGNAPAFRLSEDRAHIEGIAQELASTTFYGNEGTEPEAFTGFAPRFNSLSAENADNIIDAFSGSGGDLTSIWLVVWDPTSVHGIVPKGSKAGLQSTDKGVMTMQSTSGMREAYVQHYRQDAGLCVRDWRQVVRVANIDVSELATVANTKALVTWMIEATEKIGVLGRGRAAFYMNRNLRTRLRLGILEKIANNLTWESVSGKRVMVFDDIPVRRCDVLHNAETRVT